MINIEKAKNIILKNSLLLETETVKILSSLDRVLGEDIYSPVDISPFNNSAMDGYALLADDTRGATEANPIVLKIIEDIPAGYVGKNKITRGKAARIMTGAPIPEGADAVMMVEYTETIGVDAKQQVRIFEEAQKNSNIREKGEDIKKGDFAIPKGKIIRPQEIGMMAALNISEVKVIRIPKVAIISTGDELVDIGKDITPGKIRDVNSYALQAMVYKCGGIPVCLGIARDKKEKLQKKILAAIEGPKRCDALIISGGVSVGTYDLVKNVLLELGFEEKFWKVAIKPGKPILFGMINNIPVFGLPGNPGACIVTFDNFVRPAVLKMMGKTDFSKKIVEVICDETITKHDNRKQYISVEVFKKDSRYFAKSSGSQSSAVISSFVRADGLLIIPEDVNQVKKGEKVVVELF